MLAQASPPLDLETHQATPSQRADSHKRTWFFQGMGLAALMLVGVYSSSGLAHHDGSDESSGHETPLAFQPGLPGIRTRGGFRAVYREPVSEAMNGGQGFGGRKTVLDEAGLGEDGSEPLVMLGGFSQGENLIDERELAMERGQRLKASLAAGDLETAIRHRIEVDDLRSRDPRARYNDLQEQLQLRLEEEDDEGAIAAMDQLRMVKTFLPEHNLEGLWVGRSGALKKQVIRISYQDDFLIGTKVYSDKIVPLDEVIFKVNLKGGMRQPGPIKVDNAVDRSLRQLERFKAQGRAVVKNVGRSHWVSGQLILVGDYLAFAWLPLGVQTFFMRVPDNIAAQLETLEKDRDMLTRLMSSSVQDEESLDEDALSLDGLDLSLDDPLSLSPPADRLRSKDDEGDLVAN